MIEARRFLRYVIPGLLFFIEISLYLIFSANKQFVQVLQEWGTDIAFPISLLLASGGIGFLLGIVYHTLYWTWPFRLIVVNHQPLIKDCEKRGWIKLQKREDGSDIDVKRLSQSGAWRVVTAYWHMKLDHSNGIKAANPRTDSLTDIMHGLGATFVGSVLSIPIWILSHKILVCEFPYWYFFILPITILFLHMINFRRVIKDFQSIVDIIMSNELKLSHTKNKGPTIINLSSIDLKRRWHDRKM